MTPDLPILCEIDYLNSIDQKVLRRAPRCDTHFRCRAWTALWRTFWSWHCNSIVRVVQSDQGLLSIIFAYNGAARIRVLLLAAWLSKTVLELLVDLCLWASSQRSPIESHKQTKQQKSLKCLKVAIWRNKIFVKTRWNVGIFHDSLDVSVPLMQIGSPLQYFNKEFFLIIYLYFTTKSKSWKHTPIVFQLSLV